MSFDWVFFENKWELCNVYVVKIKELLKFWEVFSFFSLDCDRFDLLINDFMFYSLWE